MVNDPRMLADLPDADLRGVGRSVSALTIVLAAARAQKAAPWMYADTLVWRLYGSTTSVTYHAFEDDERRQPICGAQLREDRVGKVFDAPKSRCANCAAVLGAPKPRR